MYVHIHIYIYIYTHVLYLKSRRPPKGGSEKGDPTEQVA